MKYIKQQRSRRTQPGSICPTGGKQTAQKRATGSTRAARLVQAVGHRHPQSPPSQWRRPLYAPPDSPCSCGKSAQIANGCSGPKPRATINMCKPSDSGSDAPLLCHALHINGRKGPRWAHIFARAATSAALCIYHRFFGHILWPHQIDHTRRANLGAGRAGYFVCHCYAAVKVDHGPPYLHGAFLRGGNGPYGASGANLCTSNAVDPAIAPFKSHSGLQHAAAVVCTSENLIGTGRNAKLAARATGAQLLYRLRPRRNNRHSTLWLKLAG